MNAILAEATSDLLARGTALLNKGAVSEAVATLLRCCGLAPSAPEPWYALGIALAKDSKPLRGLAAIGRARRLAPQALDYALGRAELAHKADVAEGELARLAEEAGQTHEALLTLARYCWLNDS